MYISPLICGRYHPLCKGVQGLSEIEKGVLDLYCLSSKQKINHEKSCIFFFNNVCHPHCQELSELFGCHLTFDLGHYLGVPLLHERCKVSYFQFSLDQMNNKFNGWKSLILSPTNRITLAISALGTIPNYIMQTMKLPNIICNKIDRICKQFIWGLSYLKKKIHLISQNKICCPKEEGGLSFRKAKELNLACKMKLTWSLVNKPNYLWSK